MPGAAPGTGTSWKAVDRATGYNVRYGIAPDKLYSSHMVCGQAEVLLTMLNTCAEGVTVVNIDNDFGAAIAAFRMLQIK